MLERRRRGSAARCDHDNGHAAAHGVSSCLLGETVRHDGGHKRDPYLQSCLNPHPKELALLNHV